jgi:AraC-like DNA-binding protein
VVSPGQAHLIENVDNCHGYILAFNREFHSLYFRQVPELLNHSFFRLNNVSPVMTLRAENFEDLLAIIEKIKEEIQMNKRDSYNMTRTYLNIILLKLNGLFRERITENKTNTTNGLIPEFRILVEEYFMKYHQVRTYADLLNITPAKLNRVCARFTGKNASEFILERVILEAKRHLVFTNMSSKEIAYGLGYDDPSYFSRFFRKKTGYTPTRFRSEY